ncbi:MAG TPA: acireductone synthase [Pyrinomonadaceae bacterium]|nr:acireductone synthase [Pyrinomonadaceae bacterium]
MSDEVRGVLLDIEGTTTPIAFVHDVLFSYARDHVTQFLRDNSESGEVRADIELLRQEHAQDAGAPPLDATVESIANYVEWLIGCDRKSTGLKSLQGKIWRRGYLDGSLKSQVFEDVAPAMRRWHEGGLNVSIFSSGSVMAQQLLFAHTNAGDLTGLIDNYFDTNVGKKSDADSYRRIAADLGIDAREIVFISDVVAELEAARQAGMKTLLSVRPDNAPVESDQTFDRITGFTGLTRFV